MIVADFLISVRDRWPSARGRGPRPAGWTREDRGHRRVRSHRHRPRDPAARRGPRRRPPRAPAAARGRRGPVGPGGRRRRHGGARRRRRRRAPGGRRRRRPPLDRRVQAHDPRLPGARHPHPGQGADVARSAPPCAGERIGGRLLRHPRRRAPHRGLAGRRGLPRRRRPRLGGRGRAGERGRDPGGQDPYRARDVTQGRRVRAAAAPAEARAGRSARRRPAVVALDHARGRGAARSSSC